MFTHSAHLYDIIYSFKDYEGEADAIREFIYEHHPHAKSILDIACGTGSHHIFLKDHFAIEGLDLDANLLKMAKEKNQKLSYHHANMKDFSLGKTFDVITCLFSSIGYLRSVEEIIECLRGFSKHLNKDGLIIIEPWITPENWYAGSLHMLTHEIEGMKVCRMNQSATKGNFSFMHMHYLVGTEEGVQHFEEDHEMLLLPQKDMMKAFRTADLKVAYRSEGLTGRGIYLARK